MHHGTTERFLKSTERFPESAKRFSETVRRYFETTEKSWVKRNTWNQASQQRSPSCPRSAPSRQGRHRIATVHPHISVCHLASRSNNKGASPRTRPHCLFRHSADIRTATISSSASCRPQKSRDLSLRRPPTRCLPTSCHGKSSCKWFPNRAGRRCYGHQ